MGWFGLCIPMILYPVQNVQLEALGFVFWCIFGEGSVSLGTHMLIRVAMSCNSY